MMSFKKYKLLVEAGQSSGKMELVKTNVEKAFAFAIDTFEHYGYRLPDELPDFKKNYIKAQAVAGTGSTLRKDMPVIDEKDVHMFQKRLKDGYIDLNKPFSSDTDGKDPFPEGLKGEKALRFLEDGLKIHDGSKKDDMVKVKMAKITVKDLKPIQKQIYFDKSIQGTAQFGVEGTKKFLQGEGSTFIVSSDNHIIDGHHRMLSALLVDPTMKVKCMVIDLPISVLLPLSLAYGDAIGNGRNK